MTFMEHPDSEVKQALVRLTDALCSWERNTGKESVLILREQGGFFYRAASGKPGTPDDVTDEQMMRVIGIK